MTPENRRGYAEVLMARARESLQTAEKNLRIDEYKVTTSQSYYAMFYAASALLAARDIVRAKHFGVISAFGEHLAKAGIVAPVFGRRLSCAYDSRLDCDYNPHFVQTREGAEAVLEHAREFLTAAEERLKVDLANPGENAR